MSVKEICKTLLKLSLAKTLCFNITYFPLRTALRLPVFIYKRTDLYSMNGKIIFRCPVKTGLVRIGVPECYTLDMKNDRTKWKVDGTVVLNGNAIIGRGSCIRIFKEATLTIGNNFTISGGTSIISKKGITFGNDCLLSWNILMMDNDYHRMLDDDGAVANEPKPINIGHHVWIGSGCTILKGVSIGSNNVVAANSTITRDAVEEKCVISGHGKNAEILKRGVRWSHELL